MPRMALLMIVLILVSHGWCARADERAEHDLSAFPAIEQISADGDETSSTMQARKDRPIRRVGAARTNHAAAPATTGGGTGWRSMLALGAVVGLILLLAWGYRTALGTAALTLSRPSSGAGVMQIIARLPVAPRQGVALLRVGPRILVLGTGADRLVTLDVISDTETVAAISGQVAATRPESRSAEFRSVLQSQNVAGPEAVEPDAEAQEDRTVLRLRDQLADTLQRLRKTSEGR